MGWKLNCIAEANRLVTAAVYQTESLNKETI